MDFSFDLKISKDDETCLNSETYLQPDSAIDLVLVLENLVSSKILEPSVHNWVLLESILVSFQSIHIYKIHSNCSWETAAFNTGFFILNFNICLNTFNQTYWYHLKMILLNFCSSVYSFEYKSSESNPYNNCSQPLELEFTFCYFFIFFVVWKRITLLFPELYFLS